MDASLRSSNHLSFIASFVGFLPLFYHIEVQPEAQPTSVIDLTCFKTRSPKRKQEMSKFLFTYHPHPFIKHRQENMNQISNSEDSCNDLAFPF